MAFEYLRQERYDVIAAVKREIEASGHATFALANAAFIYHLAGRKAEAKAAAAEIIRRVAFTPRWKWQAPTPPSATSKARSSGRNTASPTTPAR